jgi:hypothetical protein
MNSRAKGKRGELEAAAALTRIGIECRRSAQYCGASGDADLVCEMPLHFEIKNTERLNPYRFIEQAINDSRNTKRIPITMMKSNYRPWLICLRMDDLPRLVKELTNGDTDIRRLMEGQADTPGEGLSR